MKVLVTGAGGSIGRALGRGLPGLGHDLRGLDLVGDPAPGYQHDWVVGDCLDPDVVDAAVRGVDAVAHFAGDPDEGSLPSSLESHVHTTARLLEAMLRHGVDRIAYASSNHAVGRTPHDRPLTTSVRPRPDTFYGTAKVAAEALLSLYVDRFAISAVAMRIGTCVAEPTTVRELSTWLSFDDAVRMVDAAIRTPAPGYTVVHGTSANTRGWWDLAPGRAIGFDPQDDAEHFAGSIAARTQDPDENALVGGPLALDDLVRPAF
ncbi:NAD-dependent epimerase/dehydratase family protein [Aeromicrobium stalagmiti]|uniref:NAD-dependent epimerase/dehydratase family protein n=1 Tax=Aeromicrobium stalagmiti TaxID=2738988 RepID=UPI001567F67F|nr:NAD(P)-dependent oxidoreductase [Aeromicrobium stalagmiti]NRQ49868.1 NAD(P)-dependent oxidoreductase [Aeromicrobium stalagmiti]